MSLGICLECNCCKSELYETNITHNLNKMAHEVDLYYCLWRPEEKNIKKAVQLIKPLKKGIELMKNNPGKYKKYDATNGWGTYDQFLPWLEELLKACEMYPDARIRVSR